MTPRLITPAASAALLLLVGTHARADDGKSDRAKAEGGSKAEAPPPREKVKATVGRSLDLVRSIAEEAAREERQMRFPSPATFATRFTQDAYADVLRAIARSQARLGEMAAARSTWQATLDAAAAISGPEAPKERAPVIVGIAEAQLEAGEREEARFTIRQALQAVRSVQAGLPFGLELPPGMEFNADGAARKASLLRQIARIQVQAGDGAPATETFRQAIEAAESIKSTDARLQGLVELAAEAPKGQAEAVWKRALDLAMAQDEYPRARGVAAVLRARIKAGQVDRAYATLAEQLRDDLQTYAIWVLADAVASADASIPAEVIERIAGLALKAPYDRQSKRIRVYQRVAEAQARLGLYEAAYKTVGELQPGNNGPNFRATLARVQVMAAVAEAQLRAKQEAGARDTVGAALELIAPLTNDESDSVFPVARLANVLAGTGDFRGAFEIADGITRGDPKADLLADLAVMQARAKQGDAARRTIQQAMEAGRRAPNDAIWSQFRLPDGVPPMNSVRQAVALAQARLGDLDAAFKTIGEMGSTGFAAFTRKEIAEQIVGMRLEADDIAGARRAAELITPADLMLQDDRANLVERIARSQARSHDPAMVLEWAGKEPAPRAKLQLIRGLADGVAERFTSSNAPTKPGDPSPRRPGP